MSVWNVDLTTEDGALSAIQNGTLACFIAGVLTVLGAIFIYATNGPNPATIASMAIAAIELVIYIVAGLRFRARKGAAWGSVAAVLMVLEILAKIATFTGIAGIVINAALLMATINGVRGARALGRVNLSATDAAEIFN